MDLLEYKGYEGTAELDMHRCVCFGRVLFINDAVTYEASTPDKLKTEFEAAVDDYLETCKELGREPRRPFKGLFNVRIPPTLHRAAVLRSMKDDVSLNEVAVAAFSSYLGQAEKVVHTHNHNWTVTLDGKALDVQTIRSATSGAGSTATFDWKGGSNVRRCH